MQLWRACEVLDARLQPIACPSQAAMNGSPRRASSHEGRVLRGAQLSRSGLACGTKPLAGDGTARKKLSQTGPVGVDRDNRPIPNEHEPLWSPPSGRHGFVSWHASRPTSWGVRPLDGTMNTPVPSERLPQNARDALSGDQDGFGSATGRPGST